MPTFERLVPTGVDIKSGDFAHGKVHAAIKKLKVGGASGPDGFPPLLLKKTANRILGPLSFIFSSFMSVGKILIEWSHAIDASVHQGGFASSVSNYRPISLTC